MLLPCLSGHLDCQSSAIHSYPTIKGHRSDLLSKLRCPSVVGYECFALDKVTTKKNFLIVKESSILLINWSQGCFKKKINNVLSYSEIVFSQRVIKWATEKVKIN